MPWCQTCDRFYNSRSIAPDGTCSKCGSFIAETGEDEGDDDGKIPWHFWVLVVALVIYLGWRLIQLIGWIIN